MYDVLYFDRASHARLIAAQLGRESAVTIARAEARRRRVGRMFLAGSEFPGGELVVIVESQRKAA